MSRPLDDQNRLIEQSLQALEREATVTGARRARSRQRMLDAFRAERHGDHEGSATVTGTAELVRVVDRREWPQRRSAGLAWRGVAIAAALLVAAIGGGLLVGRQPQAIETTDRAPRLVDDADLLPIELPPGEYATAALGDTVLTFEVTEPVWLVAEAPGRVELATGLEQWASRLTIATSSADETAASSSGSAIGSVSEWIAGEDRVTYQEGRALIGGATQPVWYTFVTDSAIAENQCEVGEACFALPLAPQAVELRAGGSNDVIEIPTAGRSSAVLVVWRSPTDSNQELGGFAPLIATMTFDDA